MLMINIMTIKSPLDKDHLDDDHVGKELMEVVGIDLSSSSCSYSCYWSLSCELCVPLHKLFSNADLSVSS